MLWGMRHHGIRALALAAVASVALTGAAAPARPSFAGTWALDHERSEFPKEVSFGMKIGDPGKDDEEQPRGRGGGNPLVPSARFESEADAQRRQMLTEEVRTPPEKLVISETATSITIAMPPQPTRIFHPGAKEEMQQLTDNRVLTTAKWNGTVLEVRYDVGKDLALLYRYSRADEHAPLVVEASLLNKNKGTPVKRVYIATKSIQ